MNIPALVGFENAWFLDAPSLRAFFLSVTSLIYLSTQLITIIISSGMLSKSLYITFYSNADFYRPFFFGN